MLLPTEPFDHKDFVLNLSSRPGVYRMVDLDERVIYVGKARNLKKRVGSYFRASGLTTKTMAMVAKIARIEISITHSETEALLLEQSLIKELKPPYNIQLRDDKSYPYILLTDHADYPRLMFYRGRKSRKGKYFGPYPSALATRDTLQLMQKVFKVRQCQESYFKNRTRPCLQHQIDRCTAPCVGLISPEEYSRDVRYSTLFLQGKSSQLTVELTKNMEAAADALEFEKAAKIRDQVGLLRRIQEDQVVANQGEDADVIAVSMQAAGVCVHVIYVRGGRILGSKNFFPKHRLASAADELLSDFISQSYLDEDDAANLPAELLVSEALEDSAALVEAMEYVAGRKIRLVSNVRGHRAKWLKMAVTNAQEALGSHIASKQNSKRRFALLQEALALDEPPVRIECFDISHTGGEGTVASCVVFDAEGAVKNDYRRFNIEGITPGDDYAAMEQVLTRRFERLTKGEGKLPDILLIDGGKGQLTQAANVLARFDLDSLRVLGIAKGISRRAGQETLFLKEGERFKEIAIATESPALHLLQQVRDEAHRFAITAHRQRRGNARKRSQLEDIPGLGPKRRRDLLKHFGGQQGLKRAAEAEIAKVGGISEKLAASIYEHYHVD
ncbi:excinuclease ABC subunit UvrC [Gammaproteobacteria bacterium]|jgi:excinuclease ABC subunit C|nr:excinuclease ABC subunit UvrC [Gammaproteobacteria bacterium]MDA9783773.1 excinuclease ABC subunit UvrC [Gammaproteobacteria bacterium]|tara:strand:- start:1088 stop:2932 length:1845 start_codon:yes stop_codon:yes gene_type:complete